MVSAHTDRWRENSALDVAFALSPHHGNVSQSDGGFRRVPCAQCSQLFDRLDGQAHFWRLTSIDVHS